MHAPVEVCAELGCPTSPNSTPAWLCSRSRRQMSTVEVTARAAADLLRPGTPNAAQTSTYVCMYVCMYVFVCMYVCMYVPIECGPGGWPRGIATPAGARDWPALATRHRQLRWLLVIRHDSGSSRARPAGTVQRRAHRVCSQRCAPGKYACLVQARIIATSPSGA